MRERVCKNCGGRSYKVVGQNMVKCQFCGTLYVDEHASKEEEVLTVGAYEKLRELKFEQAVEEFDKILVLYPNSFEAFFGKALAKHKIVYYNNRKGLSQKPHFFGDSITTIADDADFVSAIQNAPPETAKTYRDRAKKIDKIAKNYNENSINNDWDIFVYAVDFDKEKPEDYPKIKEMLDKLEGENLKIYFVQSLPQREKEEDTFRALHTSKAFVLFANDKSGYTDGECKNLYDRYLYFASQREKTKSSLIVAVDTDQVSVDALPKELIACKSVVEMSSTSFLQDIMLKIKSEMKNTVNEMAKIETINIKKVEPQKKEYVDIETINPNELGHYHIDNVELSETNKIKWIFLTLKHGDFDSAKELIETELAKDSNNAELLFAELLCSLKIKSQEEFFSNIANFRDREKIDKILTYATKEFAEFFVDSWENLVISLDGEEYYNAFLLYLAKFSSPNRENFVRHAENKAVETMDNELIDKVLKCFDSTDVERFVNFYFMLAQKGDNRKYYEKVLSLDAGHEQSNMVLLLRHFKTDEEKLTYRNRQEIEDVFKYLTSDTRAQFVSTVVGMVMPIAFQNLEEAEKQLDFYLAYIDSNEKLVAMLNIIATKFQDYGFFKQAERYISIAISKEPNRAEFYWLLIKIKLHCKTDNELVMSNVKVSQFPEWETMLSIASEQETEKYAEIVSKCNLYKGEKQPLKEEMPDKVHLKEKLQEFVNRNNTILLDMDKQEGQLVYRGTEYYRLQLKPFEKYLEKLDSVTTFEDYQNLCSKLAQRLSALDLTLDSSINVTHLIDKEEGLKENYQPHQERVESARKSIKDLKKDVFLKKFLFIFLEVVPILFTMLLLIISLASPKSVYMYFSQSFLVGMVIYSAVVGFANFTIYINSKEKHTKLWNVAMIFVFSFALLNLILTFVSFYIKPVTIKITNEKEMSVLLKNANYSNLVLDNDIDMSGQTWTGANFSGTLDGQNHTISNITFDSQQNLGFFKRNNGEIKNLTFQLSDAEYKNVLAFGAIASHNQGTIESCVVTGNVKLSLGGDAIVGAVAGAMEGGQIENCTIELSLTSNTCQNAKSSIGGVVGEVKAGARATIIKGNRVSTAVTNSLGENETQTTTLNYGGLVGKLGQISVSNLDISQNTIGSTAILSGQVQAIFVGGLVGDGYSNSKNNVVEGKIDFSNLSGNGYVGGLYGKYRNSSLTEEIASSFVNAELIATKQDVQAPDDTTVAEETTIKVGSLVGGLGGAISKCFTTVPQTDGTTIEEETVNGLPFVGETLFNSARASGCLSVNLQNENYQNDIESLKLNGEKGDSGVWDLHNYQEYPSLNY